ncbi:hypothetical protein MGH68_03015 [Erysipelothrix sp. D19-032]
MNYELCAFTHHRDLTWIDCTCKSATETHRTMDDALLGSLLILGGIYQGIHRETTQWWLVLSGLVLIIDSAIYNGYKQGQINWPHHAIRVILCGLAILPLRSTNKIRIPVQQLPI